ncbi:MAG: SsrA-binding protein SmpB [Candidatus Paceibacterota bacterium]
MRAKKTEILLENRRAYYDYDILEVKKAGIELKGSEVKSLRKKMGSLKGSYGIIRNNEMFLINFDIPPYQVNNVSPSYDSHRPKKLLLKKQEILRWNTMRQQRLLTIIPLKVYNDTTGLIKVDIALAKRKKKYDKRLKIKERESKRNLERIKKEQSWG